MEKKLCKHTQGEQKTISFNLEIVKVNKDEFGAHSKSKGLCCGEVAKGLVLSLFGAILKNEGWGGAFCYHSFSFADFGRRKRSGYVY